jgi:signal peptide peptidase SppA
VGAYSGVTSYEGIAAQLRAALADAAVNGIMMVWDTPGGQATEIHSLATLMQTASKPIWSIANYQAASGGYWLASSSERFASVKGGVIGSIGVVLMHADYSGELEKKGVNVTIVQRGARKVDGNPFQPLSAEARADIDAHMDELYSEFVAHVAAARGLDEQKVRDTEARVYSAAEAKKLGLIDEVTTVEKFHASMVKALRPQTAATRGNSQKGNVMSESQFTHTAAELTAAQTEARAAGVKDGVAAERKRIDGILSHDESKKRPALAIQLAIGTDLSVEQAVGVLAKAQVEAPVETNALGAPANLLAAAMKGEKNPAVGSDVENPANSGKPLTDAEKAAAERAACDAQFGKPVIGIR